MEYKIAFSFTVNNETDTLAAQLNITDNNVISLENGPIQVQSDWGATPPLTTLSVSQKSLALQAAQNTSGNPQSVKIVVPLKAVGTSLSGNLPSSGVKVAVQYQFIGYSNAGSIPVGDFTIPFPN